MINVDACLGGLVGNGWALSVETDRGLCRWRYRRTDTPDVLVDLFEMEVIVVGVFARLATVSMPQILEADILVACTRAALGIAVEVAQMDNEERGEGH